MIVVSRAQPGVKGTRWGVRGAVAVGDLAKCRREQIKEMSPVSGPAIMDAVCASAAFFLGGGGGGKEIVNRLDEKIGGTLFGCYFTWWMCKKKSKTAMTAVPPTSTIFRC